MASPPAMTVPYLFIFAARFYESPIEKGVVNKGLEDSHQAVFVISQDSHDRFACAAVGSLNTSYFHGIDKHSSQPEWNFLGKFLASHSYLKTVAKVNVQNLATHAIQKEIGRMTIT